MNILKDYHDTLTDVRKFIKAHPYRFSVYSGFMGVLCYLWTTRPRYGSYVDELLVYCNQLSQTPDSIRSGRSETELSKLMDLQAQNKLKYVNLGIVSLIMESRFSDVKRYQETSPYIVSPWWTVHRNVLDVGVLGRWIYLGKHMKDFDISDDEWIDIGRK